MRIDHPLPGDTAALRQLWKDVFADTDAFLDTFFSAAFSCDHCLCVTQDGAIVAAAYWLDCEISGRKAAYIYAVATAEQHRGQGFCRALMAHIHKILGNRGYCGSILVPGDADLRRMYGAMGYENFGGIREFTCEATHAAADLREIGTEEYTSLRWQHLQENAVLQKGANLALLDKLAKFYTGSGCLLAVSREQDLVLELLGDTAAVPGILKALGIGHARVRTAGKMPFAMYRPLDEGVIPTYFAFAFD